MIKKPARLSPLERRQLPAGSRLGRNAILIEINPEYAAMAERRIQADSPLFNTPVVA